MSKRPGSRGPLVQRGQILVIFALSLVAITAMVGLVLDGGSAFAQRRAEQNAAVARAKKALRSADKGVGLMTAGDFLAGMEQRAKAAQQRIREAAAARNHRASW